jgi:tetratricopeptide (TPR) repeat protein
MLVYIKIFIFSITVIFRKEYSFITMQLIELKKIITRQNLHNLAGSRSFGRGEDYFKSDLVGPITEKTEVISAKGHGTHAYETRLKIIAAPKGKVRLDYSCTCPVGCDGDFCKHCVALGLAWIAKTDIVGAGEEATSRTSKHMSVPHMEISLKDIRKWLEGQKSKLILDIMMDQVKTDSRLRENLTLKIAKENAGGIDITAYRKAIRSAFHTSGFIYYNYMYEYADNIGKTIDNIESLVKEGFAQEAIPLCEYAFEQAASVIGDADDSDGHFGDICERLGGIHMAACKAAKPDPIDLAKRLFDFEMMDSDLDLFYNAPQVYKTIFGKPGLAEYRRLTEKEWSRVEGKGPGCRDTGYSGKRRRITSIMESLAKADGDVNALIAIKKRDLSHPYSYLDIAEICKKAGRRDEALAWAEKGLSSFPKNQDNRLRDFVAGEYHRSKRYDEAYDLYWIQFAEQSGLEQYKKLMEYSRKIGRVEPAREDALAHLRKENEGEKKNPNVRYWHFKPDHSRLVEIFLWEKDADAAWTEAMAGGCSDRLWLELARLREKEHPSDAVDVYKRLVEPVIEQKNNKAYSEAFRMVGKIQKLMGQLDNPAEFRSYLANLRFRHKPKRNLMKLLDKL